MSTTSVIGGHVYRLDLAGELRSIFIGNKQGYIVMEEPSWFEMARFIDSGLKSGTLHTFDDEGEAEKWRMEKDNEMLKLSPIGKAGIRNTGTKIFINDLLREFNK